MLRSKVSQPPGWPVIVQVLFYWVKQAFLMEKMQRLGRVGEEGLLKAYPKIKVQYNQNVVVDNKVITSNGGPVSYQAAFELLAKLSSEKFSNEISEAIQFNRLKSAFVD